MRRDSVSVEARRRASTPPLSSRARVFTLRGVRNDGAGHPILVLRPRVHRLAAAFLVVLERLWLALNECATDGTTRQYRTHNAEPREVQYRWHPWFGRTAWVYRMVVRRTRAVAQCGLDQNQHSKSLEIPLWMLEVAPCSALRAAETPVVDCAALQRLKALLHGDMIQDRHSSLGGADADSHNSTPRSTVGVILQPSGDDELGQIAPRDSARGHKTVSETAERTYTTRCDSLHRDGGPQ